MSGSREGGRYSGHVVVGEVVDTADPWQSGSVRVLWHVGSAVQDQLSKEDLPWSRVMFSSTNPSLGQVGGPHTGLRVGSKVYGMPVDGAGQDFLVLGSVVSSGTGEPDQQQTPDSDIPTGAKQQTMDGLSQPRFSDKNNVALRPDGSVVRESIVQYARDEGGPQRRPCKYPDQSDSIGDMSAIV